MYICFHFKSVFDKKLFFQYLASWWKGCKNYHIIVDLRCILKYYIGTPLLISQNIKSLFIETESVRCVLHIGKANTNWFIDHFSTHSTSCFANQLIIWNINWLCRYIIRNRTLRKFLPWKLLVLLCKILAVDWEITMKGIVVKRSLPWLCN